MKNIFGLMKRTRQQSNSSIDIPQKILNLRNAYTYETRSKKMKDTNNEMNTTNSETINTEASLEKSVPNIKNEEANHELPKDLAVPIDFTIAEELLSIERKLGTYLQNISYRAPVQFVYNPIDYAFDVHAMYVRRYCNTSKKILFLGMNPGPWGMSQTGVPFGEIRMVREWLNISGAVGKPLKEHQDRKVEGFECKRSEVSGARLWSLFRELCGTPERFFEVAYVHNHCPIALMNQSGGNITPAELKGQEELAVNHMCDASLAAIVRLLNAEIVVGIGRYAEKRAQCAIKTFGLNARVLCIPHPSPRAVGNQNWSEKAKLKLEELGLLSYFTKTPDIS